MQILRTGGGGHNYLAEPNIWIAVKDEYAYMLSDDVYDAFVLIPLYLGMYYKQDIHIHGCVSKKLYKNVMTYLQRILCDFSDDLSRIDIHVDGFKIADGEPEIIGAGLSCGVDSLSTVYDHYVNEDDPDYRINALFFFNTGWHGDYYHDGTMKLCLDRYNLNKPAANELILPLCLVDSNFHAFMYKVYDFSIPNKYPVGHMGYLANYACVFGLQKGIRKYYMSSGFSYRQLIDTAPKAHDIELSDFSESYLVPLVQTEKTELVIDGCQYERTQKTELISDWEIAHKYLTPCSKASYNTNDAHNCSICYKCLRTLIVIEALGKLDKFAEVFDIDTYKKHSYAYKCSLVLEAHKNKNVYLMDNYKFCLSHGLKMPSLFTARLYFFSRKTLGFTKRAVRKIIGNTLYDALKKKIKG